MRLPTIFCQPLNNIVCEGPFGILSLQDPGVENPSYHCVSLHRLGFNPPVGRRTEGIDRDTEPTDAEALSFDAKAPTGAGGVGALRIEAVSIPKYRTLRISQGPSRNILQGACTGIRV